MPPVLGPVRRRRCACSRVRVPAGAPIAVAHAPAAKALGRSDRSSTTALAPPVAEAVARRRSRAARHRACSASSATVTPLPAARPSALITTPGTPGAASSATASMPCSSVRTWRQRAVGTPASLHRLLGEGLGALELRRGGGWAEGKMPARVERVHEPGDERRLGADDGEVNALALDGRHDRRRRRRRRCRAGARPARCRRCRARTAARSPSRSARARARAHARVRPRLRRGPSSTPRVREPRIAVTGTYARASSARQG